MEVAVFGNEAVPQAVPGQVATPEETRAHARLSLVVGGKSSELNQVSADTLAEGEDLDKRLFDILGASVLLLFSLPLMLLVAIAVLLLSGRPVLFGQRRLTTGGREFTMWKFRSMSRDAEVKSGPVWATVNDPRVTPLGRFLRRTRLDELPQIFNVLAGDMSLVGPRPERPEMADKLRESLRWFDKRLEVKAGLTGLAQVEAGYSGDMDDYRDKLALDILYVRKKSILLDLIIGFKTIKVILSGSGSR